MMVYTQTFTLGLLKCYFGNKQYAEKTWFVLKNHQSVRPVIFRRVLTAKCMPIEFIKTLKLDFIYTET